MNVLLIIGCLLIVLIAGHIVLRKKHRKLCADREFTEEYRDKYNRLVKKYFSTYSRLDRAGQLDGKAYAWLTMKINEMQFMMGYHGIVDYRPAFQNIYLRDYKVLLNTIPKFRNDTITESEASFVDDCLLKFLGVLDTGIETFRTKYRNPVDCVQYGFRKILSFPIEFLGWFGVISNDAVKKTLGSQVFKIVNGLVWIAGAIVTMAEIYKLIEGLWPQVTRIF
jgi:hypothetical protein